MFSKVFTSAALVLALVFQVSAHAAVAPALGVTGGKPVRANVQRPSTAKPCGNVNVASTINSATTVAANAAGVFAVTGTNFNAYVSRGYVSARVLMISSVVPMALAHLPPRLMPRARVPNLLPLRSPPTAKP